MDIEDQLVAEMKSRGPRKNVSTFAFTATPKEKTLELFGHRDKAHRLLRAFVEFPDHTIRENVRIMAGPTRTWPPGSTAAPGP